MKAVNIHIFFLALIISTNVAKAQELINANLLNKDWYFVENRGQLVDENRKQLSDIRYYGKDGNAHIYCRPNQISLVFARTHRTTVDPELNGSPFPLDRVKVDSVDYARMDMHFEGSHPDVKIIPSGLQSEYQNFYYEFLPEEGINNVRMFDELTYQNLYPGIDLKLYCRESGMKYEFVIHPGGNPADIRIKWEGTTPELLADGGVRYSNALAEVIESSPVIFTAQEQNIDGRFELDSDGAVVFKLEGYDLGETIVIDPTLNWATYYGGSDEEEGVGLWAEGSVSVVISGSTLSTTGIATSGAFQTTLSGDYDAFLAKFNGKGSRLWGTYFGGSNQDVFHTVSPDTNGNTVSTGYTFSSGLATSGAHQTTLGGDQDVILVKFSKTGGRIWSTYFGGSAYDVGTATQCDRNGNVYVYGSTQSSAGIASSGAFQTSHNGGGDAFLAKFTSNGSRTWSTYFGGSSLDFGGGLCLGDSAMLYLSGTTASSSGLATAGAHQTTYGGSVNDAFLACFTTNGSRKWATYYGGNGFDQGTGVTSDDSGFVLLTGATKSDNSIATTGAHQTARGGDQDGFLARFNSSGKIQWGTYYGGSAIDFCNSPLSDHTGNYLVCGTTSSSSGIATSGSYQSKYAGNSDAFVAQFNHKGALLKSTYFGGSGGDWGRKISGRTDSLYLLGRTNSSSGIATSGTYQSTHGGNFDAFLANFRFCIATDSTLIESACDSFVLNGITYRFSGTYKQVFSNSMNCDSIITLKLKILRNLTTITKSACDSFVLNSQVYYNTGTYVQNYTNSAGCDSTIILKLVIRNATDTVLNVSACNSYTLNKEVYDSSGTYFQKLTNYRGCDSLITLNLSILKPTDTLLKKTACDNFTLNGRYYSYSGKYTQNLTNSGGCDSIITLELTVNRSSSFSISENACDSFVLNDSVYRQSGYYFQTLTNAQGCDSSITLSLRITRSTTSQLDTTSCGSFTLNGVTYDEGGTYNQKQINTLGCDSFITLNLKVVELPDSRFRTEIDQNTVSFSPFDTSAKSYFWDFGNTQTSTLKRPECTYSSIGTYRVVLNLVSEDNCENRHDTDIAITSFGFKKDEQVHRVHVYPNPARALFYVENIPVGSRVYLIDISGKIVYSSDATSEKIQSIDADNLAGGIYFIHVVANSETYHVKLLLQKD